MLFRNMYKPTIAKHKNKPVTIGAYFEQRSDRTTTINNELQ